MTSIALLTSYHEYLKPLKIKFKTIFIRFYNVMKGKQSMQSWRKMSFALDRAYCIIYHLICGGLSIVCK